MFKSGELLKQKIRRYVVPVVATVVLAAITVVVCAAVSGKVVHIYDENFVTNFKTVKTTVGEVLEEAEIIPGEFDRVEPSQDTVVMANMNIRIRRAIPLILSDGETKEVYTLAATVGEMLSEKGIELGANDILTPAAETAVTRGMSVTIKRVKQIQYFGDAGSLSVSTLSDTVGAMLTEIGITVGELDFTEPAIDTVLEDGMTVRLVRVEKREVKNRISLGYSTEERKTSSLTKGQSRVIQKGKNGVKTETYTVVFHDAVEVSKELISEEITSAPKNKIVEIGTATPKATTGTREKGANFSYKKMIVCTATAYDLSYESCGKHPGDPYYGITASGMKAGPGVIAVDPSVIPLGTRLYVEAVDGSWTYGYCVAGDTGGGIYGNKVDLFFNTRTEVRNFGRRQANVYIL